MDLLLNFTFRYQTGSQLDSLKIMGKNGTLNVKLIFNYSKIDCSGFKFLSKTQKLLCGVSSNFGFVHFKLLEIAFN